MSDLQVYSIILTNREIEKIFSALRLGKGQAQMHGYPHIEKDIQEAIKILESADRFKSL
jgi:hypothetical protein